MQSTSAKTLIDVHCGLKFAKSPRWIGQQLLFLDIHDKCIKSADLNGTVQTVRTLSYLPGVEKCTDGLPLVQSSSRT